MLHFIPFVSKVDLVLESKSHAKSTFKSLVNVPINVSLKKGYIFITTKDDEKSIPLTKLENITENNGNIYITLGGTLPLIIPKSNDYDVSLFINEIKSHAKTQ